MPDTKPEPDPAEGAHGHSYRGEHYELGSAKPDGDTPRHATEPEGSEGSAETTKTRVDPHTGEPNEGRPDTAG